MPRTEQIAQALKDIAWHAESLSVGERHGDPAEQRAAAEYLAAAAARLASAARRCAAEAEIDARVAFDRQRAA